MERHDILEAMSELKLYGMRASFDEIAGKGLSRRDEFYPFLASLIRAERTHRQARSISYRIGGARRTSRNRWSGRRATSPTSCNDASSYIIHAGMCASLPSGWRMVST